MKDMYIGFCERIDFESDNDIILGFAVDNNESVLRKRDVDTWNDKSICKEPVVIPNEFQYGFRISMSPVEHYYNYQSHTKYRVFDPRGFALEITEKHLLKLTDNNPVRDGFLLGQYRWILHKGVFLEKKI